MSAEAVARWLPRLAVVAVGFIYLYWTAAAVALLGRAAPPEGPVLALLVVALGWGGPAYAVYRFDGVRAWLLGGRGW